MDEAPPFPEPRRSLRALRRVLPAWQRLTAFVSDYPWDALVVLVVLAIAAGFAVTFRGTSTWDSGFQLSFSRYLLRRTLPASFAPASWPTQPPFSMEYYGPAWELFLGLLADGSLRGLRDPEWVRHALNFALYPAGLGAAGILLIRAGVSRATAFIAMALLFADIRLGGSAPINTKDFPFAIAFLVVSLATWNVARAMFAAPDLKTASKHAAWLGVLAIAPALMRPAVTLHAVACLVLVFAACVHRRDVRALALLPAAYVLAAWIVAWCLWPTARDEGVAAFAHAFKLASRYPWDGTVRVFGHVYLSTEVPRWYPFAWLPVILHPFALVLAVVGLALLVARRGETPAFVVAGLSGRAFRLSLAAWLGGLTALAWVAILIAHPVLYDEDRHLSFLYPPLLVLAAFGLGAVAERARVVLAAVVVASAAVTYAAWGYESYVYVSPVVPHRSSDEFDGDYWALCVQEGVRVASERVPAEGVVVLPDGPVDAAGLQMNRLLEGRFSADERATRHVLTRDVPPSGPYYVLQYNRGARVERLMNDVRAAKARLLWETAMPTGETACALAAYD